MLNLCFRLVEVLKQVPWLLILLYSFVLFHSTWLHVVFSLLLKLKNSLVNWNTFLRWLMPVYTEMLHHWILRVRYK